MTDPDRCTDCDTPMVVADRPQRLAPWLPARKSYRLLCCPKCGESCFPEYASREVDKDAMAAGVFECRRVRKGDRWVKCAICRRGGRSAKKAGRAKVVPGQELHWNGRLLGRFTVFACTHELDPKGYAGGHWYWSDEAVRAILEYEEWRRRSMNTTATGDIVFQPLALPVGATIANVLDDTALNWFKLDSIGKKDPKGEK